MKSTFVQLQFGKIEPRHIQQAFTLFALSAMIVNRSPLDGPGGTR